MKKNKTGLILSLLTLTFGGLQAQVSDAHKPGFHSLNHIGLLLGSEKGALQLQTVEGIGYRNWFAGIGAGIDYYRFRTVPLFFDLRHYFGKTKNKLFVYGDAGDAFSRVTKSQKKNFVSSDIYKGEGYFDLGTGYSIALGRRNTLLFSIGYSQVNVKELVQPIRFTFYFEDYIYVPPERFDYHLNRLSIKIGLSL